MKDYMTIGGKQGISAAALKIIAVITMAIDHTAASILERMITQGSLPDTFGWWNFYYALRLIGRMAFPIYIYLLVEGFYYTHSRKKYAIRLFIFALISELPFDMALFNSYCDMEYQNVFFELLLGLLMMCCLDEIRERIDWGQINLPETMTAFLRATASILVIAGFACFAEFVVKCDYGLAGILAIAMMYLFRRRRLVAFAMTVATLTALSSILEVAALLMLVPMYFYNGSRGRQMKYFFYAFYPAHLLILAGACALLGLGI